jgi:predicted LPLAT superfamily acyltransferase
VEAQATNEAMTASAPGKLKPSQAAVLDELARVLPGLQFQSIIQNVMTVQDKKKWEKLFSEAHKNLKEVGQLMPQTIEALKVAHDNNSKVVIEASDIEVESVEAALFYAK